MVLDRPVVDDENERAPRLFGRYRRDKLFKPVGLIETLVENFSHLRDPRAVAGVADIDRKGRHKIDLGRVNRSTMAP